MDLCIDVYNATCNFPQEEMYGLKAQMRRAAVSISSNISEGAGRNSNGEFLQFLGFAIGSAYELQTQVLLSERLHLISSDDSRQLEENITELLKMAYAFKKTLTTNKTL